MSEGGILIVDDSTFLRKKLRYVLERAGFPVVGEAATAAEGARLFSELRPRLVLLDVVLADASGLEALRSIRAASRTARVLMMTNYGRRDEVQQALQLGALGYVFKPWDEPALLRAVESALSEPVVGGADASAARRPPPVPEPAPPTAAASAPPGRATDLVRQFQDLPSLPHTSTRLLELMSSPDVAVADLEEVVKRDQALTTKVLRLANSASFGVPRSIASVERALVLVGLTRVRSLALAASMTGVLAGGRGPVAIRTALWQHALAAALAARRLAEASRLPDPEAAFTAGLLHDVGRTIMLDRLGDPYLHLLEAALFDLPAAAPGVEQKRFGFDHSEVGGLILDRWQLPALFIEAVRRHHQPESAAGTTAEPLCCLVATADAVAHAAGIGLGGKLVETRPEVGRVAERLPLPLASLPELVEHLERLVHTDPALFAL